MGFLIGLPGALKGSARDYRRHLRTLRQYGEGGRAGAIQALARVLFYPRRTILFYPSLPDQWQVVYKLCLLNGYRMVTDPRVAHDLVHKHEKETVSAEHNLIKRAQRAINAHANDIRKARVQRVFAEVFGYELAVDPRVYHGKAVRKSDANYRHDGEIVECPYDPGDEEGVVYQRLVETENGEGFCIDLRVPFYGEEIPFVYKKYRPEANRFETFVGGELVRTDSVFSHEEVELIRAYAKRMGVDYGEMDVLRDNGDGRIYIVDVNNTPAGPPSKLNAAQQRAAIYSLAAAYRRLVESTVAGPLPSGRSPLRLERADREELV